MIPRSDVARSLPWVAAVCTGAVAEPAFEAVKVLKHWDGAFPSDYGSLCVGDVNGDRIDDVLLLRSGTPNATESSLLWLGPITDSGQPIALTELTWLPGLRIDGTQFADLPRAELRDMNGDGRADLIACNGPSRQVFCWLATAAGHFQPTSGVGTTEGFDGFRVADLDGDGVPEVISKSGFSIEIDRSTGGYLAVSQWLPCCGAPDPMQPFFVGQFDGVGGRDVLSGSRLYLNDGQAHFTTVQLPADAVSPPDKICGVTDVDGDGVDELLVATVMPSANTWMPRYTNGPNAIKTANISSTGAVTFGPAHPIPMLGPYTTRALPETNPFGARVLLASSFYVSATLPVGTQFGLLGFSAGSVEFHGPYSSGGYFLRSVAIGEVTGDGCPDVLACNAGAQAYFFAYPGLLPGRIGDGLALISGDCTASPATFSGPVTACATGINENANLIWSVAAADIDGDGWPDAAFGRSSSTTGLPKPLIFRNAHGRMDMSKPLYLTGGNESIFKTVMAIDADGDGVRDLCGVSASSVRALRVDPATPSIPEGFDQAFAVKSVPTWFQPPQPQSGYGTSGAFRQPSGSLLQFDADGDGVVDTVWVQNYRDWTLITDLHRVVVQRTNGIETRSPHSIRLAAVAQIDFDGEGDLDLVAVERVSGIAGTPAPDSDCSCMGFDSPFPCSCLPPGTLKVLINDGPGAFSPIDTSIPTPPYHSGVWPQLASIDLNGDTRPDLLLVNDATASVTVWLGTAMGLSPDSQSYPTGLGTLLLSEPTDLDHDGDLDLLLTEDYSLDVNGAQVFPRGFTMLINDGAGRFTTVRHTPEIMSQVAFGVVSDIDRDGYPDLLWSAASQAGVSMLRFPPSPCPTDLNLDRRTNTQDLTLLLLRFGQAVPPGTLGDITGDGVVNTSDLVQLLLRFGQVCG